MKLHSWKKSCWSYKWRIKMNMIWIEFWLRVQIYVAANPLISKFPPNKFWADIWSASPKILENLNKFSDVYWWRYCCCWKAIVAKITQASKQTNKQQSVLPVEVITHFILLTAAWRPGFLYIPNVYSPKKKERRWNEEISTYL